jgi:hypothetical protein
VQIINIKTVNKLEKSNMADMVQGQQSVVQCLHATDLRQKESFCLRFLSNIAKEQQNECSPPKVLTPTVGRSTIYNTVFIEKQRCSLRGSMRPN